MHALSFLQKRTHLCAVARGRAMFGGVAAMTPARFDLLYVLRWGEAIPQAAVTARLGLARQTVWEAVERLIELGLIEKKKAKRRNVLSLTTEGRRRLREALGAAFSEQPVIPSTAPVTGTTPRWWRRRELADPMPPELAAVMTAKPEAKLPPAVLSVLDAHAATPAQLARAKAALAKWDPDKALADAKSEAERAKKRALQAWPPKRGREVEKIFTSLAWNHCGQRGRRKKRKEYLVKLMDFVLDAETMARALGNTTANLYTVPFIESFDH